jgi:hypothetical protein
LRSDIGRDVQPLFYISTPPTVFALRFILNLGASGLASKHLGTVHHVIVEKPFGRDLQTAVALNDQVRAAFRERQVFRIDHYLGKETVQNILALRFANGIFEPLWNEKFVDHVQITVAESIGVGSRGGYFEESGIIRDMIQNHLMQVLTLVAMEPPASLTADAVRDEKVKVLKAIRSFRPEEVDAATVRAQYTRRLVRRRKPSRATATRKACRPSRPPRPTRRCGCTSTTGAGGHAVLTCVRANACRAASSEIAIQFKRGRSRPRICSPRTDTRGGSREPLLSCQRSLKLSPAWRCPSAASRRASRSSGRIPRPRKAAPCSSTSCCTSAPTPRRRTRWVQFQHTLRFAQRYPARVVVLCPDFDEGSGAGMRAKIYGECFLGKSKNDTRCVEFVLLQYTMAVRAYLENQVSVCLSTDMPLYYWAHRFSETKRLADYDYLLTRSKRILFDSAVAPRRHVHLSVAQSGGGA